MIKEIIGLEGAENSGKSSVLRRLVSQLQKDGKVRLLKVFDYHQNELEGLPSAGDYIAFLRIHGKIIVVATGGDLLGWVKLVIEVTLQVGFDVEVLIAAMRNSNPSVVERYLSWAKKNGVPIRYVFKPGFKRADDNTLSEKIRWAEGLWTAYLESMIESCCK